MLCQYYHYRNSPIFLQQSKSTMAWTERCLAASDRLVT